MQLGTTWGFENRKPKIICLLSEDHVAAPAHSTLQNTWHSLLLALAVHMRDTGVVINKPYLNRISQQKVFAFAHIHKPDMHMRAHYTSSAGLNSPLYENMVFVCCSSWRPLQCLLLIRGSFRFLLLVLAASSACARPASSCHASIRPRILSKLVRSSCKITKNQLIYCCCVSILYHKVHVRKRSNATCLNRLCIRVLAL